jgi:hypothetical protein
MEEARFSTLTSVHLIGELLAPISVAFSPRARRWR